MTAWRDAQLAASGDNGSVDGAMDPAMQSVMASGGNWRGRRPSVLRRLAAAPHAPAVAGALLTVAAVTQALLTVADVTQAPAQPSPGSESTGLLGLAYVLLALGTVLPAWLLRAYPVPAAVLACAACLLSVGGLYSLTVAGLVAQMALLYRLGQRGRQLLGAGLTLPYLVLAIAGPQAFAPRTLSVLLTTLGLAAAWAGASRRASSEAAEHTAARQLIAGSLLEHTARGERARVSRELHDVVAHHISMIAVQAETARLTTPDMPAAGAQRLLAIGDTARAALTEMRRLLGVLREDTRADVGPRRPQPGLAQLNELLDTARDASGSGIRLIARGPMTTLDPGVELAAYRIVQEALTNARRHADGAAVDVELTYTPDALHLRIRDNGPGPPPDAPAGGLGVLGMRERAAAVGGELHTGAAAGGGFVVEATLPTTAEEAA